MFARDMDPIIHGDPYLFRPGQEQYAKSTGDWSPHEVLILVTGHSRDGSTVTAKDNTVRTASPILLELDITQLVCGDGLDLAETITKAMFGNAGGLMHRAEDATS